MGSKPASSASPARTRGRSIPRSERPSTSSARVCAICGHSVATSRRELELECCGQTSSVRWSRPARQVPTSGGNRPVAARACRCDKFAAGGIGTPVPILAAIGGDFPSPRTATDRRKAGPHVDLHDPARERWAGRALRRPQLSRDRQRCRRSDPCRLARHPARQDAARAESRRLTVDSHTGRGNGLRTYSH